MHRLCFYIAFLLLPGLLQSQRLKRYTFTHFDNSSGLNSNQVHAVAQDEQGYVWIGTTDGLQRYDGIRFKLFNHDDANPYSLPSNMVVQLLMDAKQNLWVLLSDGRVGIFSTRKLQFHEARVTPMNPLSLRTPLKRLIVDEYGHVFLLLTGHEVLTWSDQGNEFSAANNFFQQDKNWAIADFAPQPGTHNYWMSIQGGGLAIYNDATHQLSHSGQNREHLGIIDEFEGKFFPFNLHFDRQSRLWFNSWDNGTSLTYCYDLLKKKVVLNRYNFFPTVKTYFETRGFMEQKDGTMWIKGVMVFAQYLEKENTFEQIYNGTGDNKDIGYRVITCLFEDRENNIWVGTGNNGLFRFNPRREFFTNVGHINRATGAPGEGSPLTFMRDRDGSLLVGYWGDGLFRFDKNFDPIPLNIHGIANNNVASVWGMFASPDSSTIWMAAQPGLFRYDNRKRSAVYYNPPILQNRTVREVAEDRTGNLWIGMQAIGLYKWKAQAGKIKFDDGVSKFTAVPDVQVNHIRIDSKGLVWVATSAEGLFVIDPVTDKVVMHFEKKGTGFQKLPEEGVSATIQYDDSLVIISTATQLLKFNSAQKKTTVISRNNLSGGITAMQKDKTGYIWISTNSALYRLTLQKRILIRFDRNDGMMSDYFILASSYTLPDGRMLFGTTAQFIAFDPAEISAMGPDYPRVSVSDFKVMNKPLLIDSLLKLDHVTLKPDQNSIDIEFSYLRSIKAYAITYKLQGLDKDWKIADADNRAVYSYLPPGTYTLMLTTLDAEGNTGKIITKLVIRIKPPFWKTWWFFCLLTLVIAGVFYWLDSQRINRLLALQKVRTEIAGNLHEEVNTTLNNISLLSEMARIKAVKDPERSKEYIAQISTKSQSMINSMDDILWSIDPENDNMEKSLLRMMEYADNLKNLYGVNIEIALDKKVKSLKLDMKMRHEFLLIFKQALRVIVQHSGGKNTIVHIDLFKSRLSLRLQDPHGDLHNDSAEVEDLIGDMHTRASEMGADLDVQCDNTGLTILLLIPVN